MKKKKKENWSFMNDFFILINFFYLRNIRVATFLITETMSHCFVAQTYIKSIVGWLWLLIWS